MTSQDKLIRNCQVSVWNYVNISVGGSVRDSVGTSIWNSVRMSVSITLKSYDFTS